MGDDDSTLHELQVPRFYVVGVRLLALLVSGVAVALSLGTARGGGWMTAVALTAAAVPWAVTLAGVELSRPVFAAMTLVPVAAVSLTSWGEPEPTGTELSLSLVLLLLCDMVLASRRELVAVITAAIAILLARWIIDRSLISVMSWSVPMAFAVAACAGVRVGGRAIAEGQRALATQASADVRRDMARDIHAVVAHTLTVTMLHISRARLALLRSAPAQATEALEEAEQHGRSSLNDIRRIIRLLRADGDEPVGSAQPGLVDLVPLVDGYRRAGLAVGFRLDGPAELVTPSAALAVYRVAQEALANASRHGPGSVEMEVAVGVEPPAVVLTVHNPLTRSSEVDAPAGPGLAGMRERVRGAGGTIELGPETDEWVVRARIPVGTLAAETPAAPVAPWKVWAHDPDEEEIQASIEMPASMRIGTRALAIAVAVAAVAGSLGFDDGDDRVTILVVGVMVLPWVLSTIGVEVPLAGYAVMTLGPAGALPLVAWLNEGAELMERPNVFSFGSQASLLLIVLMMSELTLAPRRQTAVVAAVAFAIVVGRAAIERDVLNGWIWVLAVAFGFVAETANRVGAVSIARGQRALSAQRAADQRRRIARDVHDVVAHTLAVTMLHLTAARMAVGRSQAAEATEALEEAETQGRTSLADVRRIVTLLRREDDDGAPGELDVADIRTLVEGFRTAGLPVELHLVGPMEDLGPTLGSTVYRVLQEALANAARHGGGAAEVSILVRDQDVLVEVRNPIGAAAGAGTPVQGSGLRGMEERVNVVGGDIETGPRRGEWLVRARIPHALPAKAPEVRPCPETVL